MAGVISENFQSRSFELGIDGSRELLYDVVGTDDETEVEALVRAAAEAASPYLGLVLDTISVEAVAADVWKCRARYATISSSDSEYTFDTGGGNQRITQSFGTINAYALGGGTPPDFQGAIGVSEDRVEGVDIPVPNFQFSETHRFASTFVDSTFKRTLFTLTGTFNNASFKGFDAGECLFLGASGSQRGDELWSITFRFAGSPNVTGLTVGGITGIDKYGWDYMWVLYEEFVDNFAYKLVQRPVAAYVERVLQPADFSLLSIGT